MKTPYCKISSHFEFYCHFFPLVSNSLRHRTIDICLSVRLLLYAIVYSVPAIPVLKLYASVIILVG